MLSGAGGGTFGINNSCVGKGGRGVLVGFSKEEIAGGNDLEGGGNDGGGGGGNVEEQEESKAEGSGVWGRERGGGVKGYQVRNLWMGPSIT